MLHGSPLALMPKAFKVFNLTFKAFMISLNLGLPIHKIKKDENSLAGLLPLDLVTVLPRRAMQRSLAELV